MPDRAPRYNLKAVSQETGLPPETLRAWERRYQILAPQRTSGGHRLYSEYDIQLLKWLVARQHEGMSISRAAELWKSQQAAGQDPLALEAVPVQAVIAGGVALDDLRGAWLEACLNFNEQAAEAVLNQAFAVASPETACIEVLQKGLFEIGEKWYQGEASVQHEHFASSLAMRRLHTLLAAAPPPVRIERILAACPSGEEHEFGLLLSAFLLRRRGWPVVYLGANVPLNRLEAALSSTSPRLVLALAQTLPTAASLQQMGRLLQQAGVQLVYGGGIFARSPVLQEYIPGHFLGTSISAVPSSVEKVLSYPNSQPSTLLEPSAEQQALLALYLSRQPLIEAQVAEELKGVGIQPMHLQIAQEAMAQHMRAALMLGDPCLLEASFAWIKELILNHGLFPTMLDVYLQALADAIQEHLQERAAPILACLPRPEDIS
jgi:MerR family transcriptional regulator, light-induced transcriptional regulator